MQLVDYVEIENYRDLVTQPTTFTFFFSRRRKASKLRITTKFQFPFDFDENIPVDEKTSLITYV